MDKLAQFQRLSREYFTAAEILYANSSGDCSNPLLFLYLHSVELLLKAKILSGFESIGLPEDFSRYEKLHDLGMLFEGYALLEGDRVPNLIQSETIEFLASIDPKSTAFRYPKSLQAFPEIPKVKRCCLEIWKALS